jgi:hypothetical protein
MVQGPGISISICARASRLLQLGISHHTWTYSTTLLSPRSRVADTLVAGNAFGTTFRTVRRRELVTDRDEIVTVQASLSVSSSPLSIGGY